MKQRDILAEFIYRLNEKAKFLIQNPFWSQPFVGFSFDSSLPPKFLKALEKGGLLTEGTDAVICILGEWGEVAEGIIFTDRAMYLSSPKNSQKKLKVRYCEITRLRYESTESAVKPRLLINVEGNSYDQIVDVEMWSKRCIYDYLQFACGKLEFDKARYKDIMSIRLEQTLQADVASLPAGIVYGNVSNASSIYFDDKILTPRGHGFAAEHANHLYDVYRGKHAKIVGDDNAKNGPDRLVNGVQIQSKYCRSGSACIQGCFQDGKFCYWNPDGTPMQIEVPSDMYDAALQAMKSRIVRGEVAGVTDINEAENIIRKGHFTYAQARNTAKSGTVESIVYDAASGAIIARNSFGLTAVLTFAGAIWNGADMDMALESAAIQGLKVSGATFVTAVLSGQLSKAGLNSALVESSEALARMIGPKTSALIVNAFRSGTNIYGNAAVKSLAKLFRTNGITAAVSFTVLSIGDVGNIFSGRISGSQLFKNMTKTASSIAGGTAGWLGGSTAGALVGSTVPVIGTGIGSVVGGIAGALGGGGLASGVTGAVLDAFIEDDANQMVEIIQEVFTQLSEEYLISKEEADKIVDLLQKKLTGDVLKSMYSSGNRANFARCLMEDYFKDILYDREYIALPTLSKMQKGIRLTLGNIETEDIEKILLLQRLCSLLYYKKIALENMELEEAEKVKLLSRLCLLLTDKLNNTTTAS